MYRMPLVVVAVLAASYGASLLLFPADTAAPAAPAEVSTRTDGGYETPLEKTVVLSDGRKLVCLQASYGGLWCTPAL